MPERFFLSESVTGNSAGTKGENSKPDTRNNYTLNPLPERFASELKMLNKVRFTLCTNSDIVQTIPSFVQALDTFKDHLNKITGMYRDIKKQLIQFTCRLAEAVKTYGVMIDNSELIEESSVREDDLENQSDEVLLNKSNKILEDARIYLQPPNPFGIYHEILSECEAVMDNFGYAIDKTAYSPDEKNSWKNEHDALFVNAHEFLQGTLDTLAESLKTKHPGFYREYQLSRTLEKPDLQAPSAAVPPDNQRAETGGYYIPY